MIGMALEFFLGFGFETDPVEDFAFEESFMYHIGNSRVEFETLTVTFVR